MDYGIAAPKELRRIGDVLHRALASGPRWIAQV